MGNLKRKSWAILIRKKSNNKIFGYSFFSKKFTKNFLTVARQWSNDPLVNEIKWLERRIEKIKSTSWYSDSEFEIFITRIGSKHCPIKVNWGGFITTQNRRPEEYHAAALGLGFCVKS
ncbi:hypothetical protein [Photobacterium kishitanii]|uniref:Uncharacterized protein n=1 Tax=Photobacterium kishitanii TaxID=318456 RepID=A0A2T3KLZ2_9GAMM|nr:hypothetical protein [Photobacterium kishitanii]PSV00715.1 hypothetical protein C9J27_06120 [Photobacterium kishitanii]